MCLSGKGQILTMDRHDERQPPGPAARKKWKIIEASRLETKYRIKELREVFGSVSWARRWHQTAKPQLLEG